MVILSCYNGQIDFQKRSETKWQLIAGDMNDALCNMTWSGPQKKNYQMGYICEVEYDAKHRSRRAAEESSCQVEYRTRQGLLLNVQMSCKARGWDTNRRYQ